MLTPITFDQRPARRSPKLCCAILAGMAMLVLTGPAMAGRPLITDDADTIDPMTFEFEAGFDYAHDSTTREFGIPIALTMGILPRVEIGIGFGALFQRNDDEPEALEDFSDITLGGKVKLLDQEQFFLSQAIAGSVTLPIGHREVGLGTNHFDADVTWIATRSITEQITILWNLGYTWVGEDDDQESDILHYGPAVTWKISEHLEPVAEIVFETPTERGKTAAGFNVGLRYNVTDALILDTAIGSKIAGEWPDLTFTLGLTWAFGGK